MNRSRGRCAGAAVAVLIVLAGGACGSDGDRTEQDGVRHRAVESLTDFGLPEQQAECITDDLGAETVVAAPEAEILAAGQPYQDAVKRCSE